MPVVGQISVGDGATFTPSVSNSGVISWSNDKNLPNPASVDIADVVQTAISGVYLPTAGGTVTGNLTVNGTLTGNLSGNATTATTATTALSATTATSATNDGNGNVITATYLPLAGGTITGNTTVSADLSVTGDIFSNDINATGTSTLAGLTVSGATSLAGLSTTGNASVGGDLSATGNITGATVTTTGGANFADLTVTGTSLLTGDVTAQGDISVTGTTATGDLTATGDSAFNNVAVSGTAALNGTSTAVTPAAEDNSTKIATTAYVQTEIKPIETDVTINEKRISNIEKLLEGNLYDYQTDSDSAYTKTVPNGAMPYASLDEVGGKTLVMNQNVEITTSGWSSNRCSLAISDDVFTLTCTSNSLNSFSIYKNIITNGHKYYLKTDYKYNSTTAPTQFVFPNFHTFAIDVAQNTWATVSYVGTYSSVNFNPAVSYASASAVTIGDTFSLRNVVLVDLTLMFGSGNEPTTVAEFQQMFPAQYYQYTQGTLLSAGVTEVVSKGKNLANGTVETHGSYGGYTINPQEQTITLSISDNDSTVSITGMSLGLFNADWNANGAVAWLVLNGNINHPAKKITSTLPNLIVYPTTALPTLQQRFNIQAEYGSTATTYSAPFTNDYPIPAEIQALEGYGWSAGSVYNYIDYERKVFVKCVSAIDMGSMTWDASYNMWRTNGITSVLKIDSTAPNLLNAKYPAVGWDNRGEGKMVIDNGGRVYVMDSTYADATAFKTAMNGVMLYYELATPIETDISAYLTDDNLISVESGGTLTFPNQHGDDYRIPVPSSETFMVDLQSAL